MRQRCEQLTNFESGAILQSDHLAGDFPRHRPDLALVVEGAGHAVISVLLNSAPVEFKRKMVAALPAEPPDLVDAFWLAGIRLSAEGLVIANPVTAADAAIRHGHEVPPALRGQVISAGWARSAECGTFPFACAADLVRIIRDAHARRAAESELQRAQRVVWTSGPRRPRPSRRSGTQPRP